MAGGASTAARLRRLDEHAEIVIFEKGQYISYANCGLPYYIGEVIKDRNKLFVQTVTAFSTRFNVDVRISTEVVSIDRLSKTVTARNLTTGQEYTETYDKLVLSPGASPVRPNLPGIHLAGIFTVRNVADTDFIKQFITNSQARRAVIIGAGFIGLEMAENLHKLGMEVSVVEMGKQILAPADFPIAAIAQKHLREKGIQLFLSTAVKAFEKQDGQLKVRLVDDNSLNADVIILSIGVKPDIKLAESAGLRIGKANGIWVDEYLQTSDPDIYAVGDAIEFPNPISGSPTTAFLAGPANKQGRICANNLALGNIQTYCGSVNTAIVKLFDLTIGVAGIAIKHLESNKIPHQAVTIHGNSHAGYYPGAQLMTIQIAFSPTNGQLLSAQVIGGEGVDKRLDLLANVIKTGGSIFELAELEHAYAPPFSSAKDPVNMAGFAAENIMLGRLKVISCEHLPSVGANAVLIDVRTPAEFAVGTINGAVNVPLDEIRNRLTEIPKNEPVYIFCQQGMRGYLAQRILVQNGFDKINNLSGGYFLWKTYKDETDRLRK